MRRLVFALLMLITMSLSAQNDDVIKFMGISIDGTLPEMISSMQQKGFTFIGNDENEAGFEGIFDGYRSNILVITNHGKVYRVFVARDTKMDSEQAKATFNAMVYRFNRIEKYSPLADLDYSINQDEDLSYTMFVEHKHYSAFYKYKETGLVWFTLSNPRYNEYYIAFYYDNLLNAPNDDDL